MEGAEALGALLAVVGTVDKFTDQAATCLAKQISDHNNKSTKIKASLTQIEKIVNFCRVESFNFLEVGIPVCLEIIVRGQKDKVWRKHLVLALSIVSRVAADRTLPHSFCVKAEDGLKEFYTLFSTKSFISEAVVLGASSTEESPFSSEDLKVLARCFSSLLSLKSFEPEKKLEKPTLECPGLQWRSRSLFFGTLLRLLALGRTVRFEEIRTANTNFSDFIAFEFYSFVYEASPSKAAILPSAEDETKTPSAIVGSHVRSAARRLVPLVPAMSGEALFFFLVACKASEFTPLMWIYTASPVLCGYFCVCVRRTFKGLHSSLYIRPLTKGLHSSLYIRPLAKGLHSSLYIWPLTKGLHSSLYIRPLTKGLHSSLYIRPLTKGLHSSLYIRPLTKGLHSSLYIRPLAKGLHSSLYIRPSPDCRLPETFCSWENLKQNSLFGRRRSCGN